MSVLPNFYCESHGYYDPNADRQRGCPLCWKAYRAAEEALRAEAEEACRKAEEKRLKRGCQTALQLLYASTFAQAMPFEDFMALLKLAKREFEALK